MDENVQPTETVEATTVETKGETPKAEPAKSEPFSPEALKYINELIKSKTEEISSHFQSVKDKELKPLKSDLMKEKRARQSVESQLNAINEMALRDPATAAKVRAAQTQAQASAFRQQELREQQEQNTREFYSTLEDGLTEDKIDPKDERIDWGMDAPSPVEALRRFNTSVAKIKKENAKVNETKRGQEIKDFEMRLRKELGLDSADKTASAGAGHSTDEEFLSKFGSGELPYTKENVERANKLLSK